MIDILICIIYILMGARWILKRVKMEAISAPTNWKIIVLKFLIWLIAPLEIFIYIYFYNSERVRIFLGASVMLLYLIETRLLFNEMSKAIVKSNIDNREKDVKHILEKRKFRIQLGIIFVLYVYFMIWHGFLIDLGNGTTTLFIHLFLGITKVIHNDFISISIMFLTPFVLVYVISLALFWILCALNGKNQCYQRK